MFDRDRWQEIFSVLRKNKLRTFFTAFGVFWGIFMLIIMLGSGNGLYNGVRRDMGDMATNSFFMWTQNTGMPYKGFPRGRWYRFNNDDTRAIREQVAEVDLVAPRLQGWGGQDANNVVRGINTGAFSIYGDYPEYNMIRPMDIVEGRFINQLDIQRKRKVAVIGTGVEETLFEPGENAIGEYIRIKGVYFMVVGVFATREKGQHAQRENQAIYMPFTTLQKTYNFGNMVGWYSITSREDVPASVAEEKVKALMRERHSIHPDDLQAVGSWNVEEEFRKMKGLFAGINGLIWIVGIGTLFAGVVGVSNIMLIIVKERTSEIGIQRAIGASPRVIISQIITESVFLTLIAGYVGLVVGVAILEGVNMALQANSSGGEMFQNPGVSFEMAVTSLAVLVFSGVLAGLIPARRAVSIKPIDALREEK